MASTLQLSTGMTLSLLLLTLALASPGDFRATADTVKVRPPAASKSPPALAPSNPRAKPAPPKGKPVGEPQLTRRKPPPPQPKRPGLSFSLIG